MKESYQSNVEGGVEMKKSIDTKTNVVGGSEQSPLVSHY
jgi:hypothetical protein